ncbi:glutamine-hydrolyzing GMP synthase [Pseudodesulfovibrio senegalensis]|jgi:GMP synthase (glutamine-hydrolysing)|uniref:GMP synthase [glutamine-hydrolyzing] n=1 Tax=Pseudodesulfovibrio senegalensis TaxID=1721087 RepID=A0A6N6N6A9_9BACT|nr:glutamine-hydrolyzing GMP synthase [Pseudodesulfovibrio senegalensis]KAB1443271.1 glutamine-hydrolyzing GMP synthase [Pseudodesulfovibrio senegalensis]
MLNQDKVVILDFGSQFTQLIARRIREAGVYSEIHPCNVDPAKVKALNPQALILSGGPSSVLEGGCPDLAPEYLEWNLPTLGICYGMQLLAHKLGGKVVSSKDREYGRAEFEALNDSPLFDGIENSDKLTVWMSHGDRVQSIPDDFEIMGKTESIEFAAMGNRERKIYALQFHPEVAHTDQGAQIINNFLFKVADLKPSWSMSSFVETCIEDLKRQVGDDKVVLGLSGGIDSTVAAVLLHKAIGRNLHCIFVDNGLLRMGEREEVIGFLAEHFDLNVKVVDAADEFLGKLKGVTDPEKKRKIIGYTFIDVFDREAKNIDGVKFLGQGTLYPDVIESESFKGPSAVIKSHHNVGGLPETMNLELVEPLRELFKDEVRRAAYELGLPEHIIWRHPFPGPGLSIRILGEITEERLQILRLADRIVQNELIASDWYRKVWQGFAVLLPLKTVGVMGDGRTYENVIALRIVDSIDAMTADWTRLPSEVLARMSNRIINEVQGVNRVVLDISSKPPSTIEWE